MELRNLRIRAGLSGPGLAETLGASQSRISRTETGKSSASLDLVGRWLDATDAPKDVRQSLLDLASAALTAVTEYRTIFRGSLLTAQQERIRQDAAASRIRHFQPAMIPGPLQTSAYARAALLAARVADERDIDEAVEARMERGDRLRQPGAPTYEVILTELAFRWRPLSVDLPTRDLAWRHILSIEVPNLSFRIIPADAPIEQAPMCAFMITDFADSQLTIVQVELPAVEMTFSAADDVEAFELAWRRMSAAALDPQQSAKVLRQMLRGPHSTATKGRH